MALTSVYGATSGVDEAALSNTISRQFNDEFVTKGIVEMDPRKKVFSKRSNTIAMPKNKGDKFTKLINYPIIHKDNMMDNGVDASVAQIVSGEFYLVEPTELIIDAAKVFKATDYIGVTGEFEAGTATITDAAGYAAYIAAGKTDYEVAVIEARLQAEAALTGTEVVKSSAGALLNGSASYMASTSNLVPLPEQGGVVNLMNGSTKLVSAKMSFHAVGSLYTVRSVNLDSRMGQVAQKIKDLSRAVGEIKEMQVQASLIGSGLNNNMACSAVGTDITDIGDADVLTYDYLTAFEVELQRDDVPMSTEMITGIDLVDTRIIEDAYTLYCTSEIVPTLRNMTDTGDTVANGGIKVWVPKAQYAANGDLMDGEIGSIGSFRFVVVKDLQKFKGKGEITADTNIYSTPVAKADGTGTEIRVDVHPLLFIGDDSFSTAAYGFANTAAAHIPPKRDVHNDMHAQVGGVSANWSYGYLCYRPERIKMLTCAVSKSGR